MSIQSNPFKISLIPRRLEKLKDVGKEERMTARDGSVHAGSVARQLIEFMLDLRYNEEIKAYLAKTGGSFTDLVVRALKYYITQRR